METYGNISCGHIQQNHQDSSEISISEIYPLGKLENGYVKLVSLLSLLDSIPTAAITDP